MEIRELHAEDIESLIALYTQLDEINAELSYEETLFSFVCL